MKSLHYLVLTLLALSQLAYAGIVTLPPYQESTAYKQYQRRPKTELSKLVYIMDRFKNTEYKVVYNKVEYDSNTALKHAKDYVAKKYKKEPAVEWIKANAYRSSSGQIIYFKEPDGKTKVLRDVLIEELKYLK